MRIQKWRGCIFLLALLVSVDADAWFIFFPGSAIERAFEKDPDSISASSGDRTLGKCAGYHVNQARKFSTAQSAFPDSAGASSPQTESPETVFHANMADVVAAKASEKEKIRELAGAYSTRWSRVAGADINANRAYGADLARSCVQNDIPFRLADHAAWQARQNQGRRQQADDESRRAEEARNRALAEEEARRSGEAKMSIPASDTTVTQHTSTTPKIDFTAEARKSARILGCGTQDVRVIGIDGQNILFSANCDTARTLVLTCDQSGLCLQK